MFKVKKMELTICTYSLLRGWMRETQAQADETKKEQEFQRRIEVLKAKALLTIVWPGDGVYRDAV